MLKINMTDQESGKYDAQIRTVLHVKQVPFSKKEKRKVILKAKKKQTKESIKSIFPTMVQ